MMKTFTVWGILLVAMLTSCTAERYTSSPLNSALSDADGQIKYSFKSSIEDNVYASEITNLLSTFPKLANNEVNSEITKLKENLRNYLYAYEASNHENKQMYLKKIQYSYKTVQKLRKNLNTDENLLINRYMVKIKTNMVALESTDKNL